MPLRHYRGGDGKKYFRWALTGLEPIFSHLAGNPLSRFQWYVVQWIEIENRAMGEAADNRHCKSNHLRPPRTGTWW